MTILSICCAVITGICAISCVAIYLLARKLKMKK